MKVLVSVRFPTGSVRTVQSLKCWINNLNKVENLSARRDPLMIKKKLGFGGFTLIELMVTLAIAAILMAIAVPSFKEIIRNNRLTTYTNEFVTSLNLARSEAVKRGTKVSLRILDADSSTNAGAVNWDSGWDVFTDADGDGKFEAGDILIKTYPALMTGYIKRSDNFAQYIQFDAFGMGNSAGSFIICENSDNNNTPEPNTSRLIDIRSSGKITIMEDINSPKDGIPNKTKTIFPDSNITSCVFP